MSTATPIPVRSPLPGALSGATVVLVGGSSGIGLAAAVLLRSIGARVVLVGRDPDRLEAAASRVRGSGPDDAVLGVTGDGGDERTLAEAFDRAGRVDHVYVTAGGISGAGPLAALSADDIRTTLGSGSLQTAFTVARAAATRLPAGGSLTFSSGILVVRPAPGMTVPLSAAGAVETLTRALAVELAPARVRVNAVRYGRIDTPLLRSLPGLDSDDAVAAAGTSVPLGRFGTAEEAAATAVFLMANNHVTGQVITVDGGETLV
ncbi:SDR family oxidoreductase [Microbispora hainanensis]|uniref:SDR family oxidoreductase n=1 Tax=Microbispora hainanensis TaxID=568844 RepID=A0ABZ1SZF5_9ACTN|nr:MULTISPECIES: SDR family oxidoreductase [Microbispora]NJP23490.1 SDR family oxidoreductase [Microbispora sp. CL1-1]TQS15724.1 SDR family oxidoreductase [Microbispora sp. SCL1-1]